MVKNNNGFIDILFTMILCAFAVIGIISVYHWFNSQDLNEYQNIIDQKYTEVRNKFNDKTSSFSFPDKDIPKILQDLDLSEEDTVKLLKNPASEIMQLIMKKCIKNGRVSQECKAMIDQYTDSIIPDEGGKYY